jgi:hypothetical protein
MKTHCNRLFLLLISAFQLFSFPRFAVAATVWPIRLACDEAIRAGIPVDLNTGGSPLFTRGDDLEFQLGFFQNGVLITNWANVNMVTLSIYQLQNDTNPPLLATNLYVTNTSFNTNLTQTDWTNGLNQIASTNQHADIFIPGALSAITLNGQASQGYWLRVEIQTTNAVAKIYTALLGPITVQDGPIGQQAAQGISDLVTVDGFGNLFSPTNFFAANAVLLWQLLTNGPTTSVTIQTNSAGPHGLIQMFSASGILLGTSTY